MATFGEQQGIGSEVIWEAGRMGKRLGERKQTQKGRSCSRRS